MSYVSHVLYQWPMTTRRNLIGWEVGYGIMYSASHERSKPRRLHTLRDQPSRAVNILYFRYSLTPSHIAHIVAVLSCPVSSPPCMSSMNAWHILKCWSVSHLRSSYCRYTLDYGLGHMERLSDLCREAYPGYKVIRRSVD